MMKVMRMEMGSECPLSFPGDEPEMSLRAVKGKMMASQAALGMSSLYCQPGCYPNSIRRGQEMVVWQEV